MLPACHQPSARIHGHYQRTVADLPCAGRTVILALTVRKFVCTTPTCSHRIFTERLPGLVEPYARMTPRLIALVQGRIGAEHFYPTACTGVQAYLEQRKKE